MRWSPSLILPRKAVRFGSSNANASAGGEKAHRPLSYGRWCTCTNFYSQTCCSSGLGFRFFLKVRRFGGCCSLACRALTRYSAQALPGTGTLFHNKPLRTSLSPPCVCQPPFIKTQLHTLHTHPRKQRAHSRTDQPHTQERKHASMRLAISSCHDPTSDWASGPSVGAAGDCCNTRMVYTPNPAQLSAGAGQSAARMMLCDTRLRLHQVRKQVIVHAASAFPEEPTASRD